MIRSRIHSSMQKVILCLWAVLSMHLCSAQVFNVDSVIYFGSTFNYAGIDRLLVPVNSSHIYSVLANNFPQYDQVFVVVNSTKYGGSGGFAATASINSSSAEIAIHEMGHSFAALRDEYW